MSYSSVFLAKARLELIDSFTWYEERQEGLGERFTNAVFECIDRLEKAPHNNAARKRVYYEIKIKAFPYLIVYRIEEKQKLVVILSVFHTSRNPRKKL